MVATASVTNSASFEVTTPADEVIHFARLFDAPRKLVFEAMTKPEHVRNWWGRLGDGYSVPVCEIDLRVGGAWRFVNRHPQGDAVFFGEYREVSPHDRLVYTEIFEPYPESVSVVTAEFTEVGSKTRYTASVRYPSVAVRDMVLGTGMQEGAAASYDQLEALLARLQRS